jgi:hypothetical protein
MCEKCETMTNQAAVFLVSTYIYNFIQTLFH